ncbi:MAG: uroporphyrinogen-III C-methyltransferase [Geodermatophilaceae bacterium]|nr:uroporphyrinogen-III C-methyltransferase [Geodermatophilaceae bacterium]
MTAGPLFSVGLRLDGRRCVVVGGGEFAHRRVAGLLEVGAQVRLVSLEATPALEALAAGGELQWERRPYAVGDLAETWYVVAATGLDEIDDAVAIDAEVAQIFCTRENDSVASTAALPGIERLEPTTPPGIALVGGGPGDPGLMTLRGRQLLGEADVVIADHLAPQSFLAALADDVLIIDASKLPKGRSMAQQQINDLLVAHGRAGRRVVRLKGGDPFVFGRGMEEVEACTAAGLPVEVVPGVTSAVAVPAIAGIPVTHRGVAHEFVVVSGHLPPGHPESLVDWSALGRLRGTVVVLMGVHNADAIASALIEHGRAPDAPAAAIYNGGLHGERVLTMKLVELGAVVTGQDLRPPAVLVIGGVAAFAAYAAEPIREPDDLGSTTDEQT